MAWQLQKGKKARWEFGFFCIFFNELRYFGREQ